MKPKRQNDLGNDPIGSLLIRLAIPAITAQLVNALYNIVDRMYIGHIEGTGDLALTGLGVETGDISQKIQRGKNTTRHAELLEAKGLRVLDTAGFSLLEMEGGMDPVTLKDAYPEFAPYEGQCRFAPCYHASEPGCAVTAAVAAGELDPQRVERYRELLADVRKAWRERYD